MAKVWHNENSPLESQIDGEGDSWREERLIGLWWYMRQAQMQGDSKYLENGEYHFDTRHINRLSDHKGTLTVFWDTENFRLEYGRHPAWRGFVEESWGEFDPSGDVIHCDVYGDELTAFENPVALTTGNKKKEQPMRQLKKELQTERDEWIEAACGHWLYVYHLPNEEGIVTDDGLLARRKSFREGFKKGIDWILNQRGIEEFVIECGEGEVCD